MFSFVRRRMYTSALPLIIVLLGVFLLARMTGDPTNLYLPESATAEQRADFAAKNGFDQPLWTQLVDYFKGVIHLDFGTSLRTGESASEMALSAGVYDRRAWQNQGPASGREAYRCEQK